MRALSIVLTLPALLSCGGAAPTRVAPEPPAVLLHRKSAAPVRVGVELARTPAELSRGLMHRQKLGENEGMLFLFPRTAVQSFWMKNTLIPLDMIFIGEDFRVVGVVENAEPMTLGPRTVGIPSRYVLEVNGGFAARTGIGAGTVVEFLNLSEGGP